MTPDETDENPDVPLMSQAAGANIRVHRQLRDLTQDGVAGRMTEISGRRYGRATILGMEQGTRKVALDDLPPLCFALKEPLERLLLVDRKAAEFRLHWSSEQSADYARQYQTLFGERRIRTEGSSTMRKLVAEVVRAELQSFQEAVQNDREGFMEAYRQGFLDGVQVGRGEK